MTETQDPKRQDHPRDEAALRDLLERAGHPPPLAREDVEALTRAARAEWRMRWAAQRPTRRRDLLQREHLVAIAATLAVALGAGAWWLWLQGSSAPVPVARVEAVHGSARAVDANGEVRTLSPGGELLVDSRLSADGGLALALAGGAALRLDAGSHLQLLGSDLVLLSRGALYVDTGRPAGSRGTIEVRTPLGTATDIGTRFALRLRTEEGTLRVRVRDGAVALTRGDRRLVTEAGQELLIREDGSTELTRQAPFGQEWAWVLEAAPGFDLEGKTLAEFLDWVSYETGWRVHWTDPDLEADVSRRIFLSATLRDVRADEAAFDLLPAFGLEGNLDDQTLIVSRP